MSERTPLTRSRKVPSGELLLKMQVTAVPLAGMIGLVSGSALNLSEKGNELLAILRQDSAGKQCRRDTCGEIQVPRWLLN